MEDPTALADQVPDLVEEVAGLVEEVVDLVEEVVDLVEEVVDLVEEVADWLEEVTDLVEEDSTRGAGGGLVTHPYKRGVSGGGAPWRNATAATESHAHGGIPCSWGDPPITAPWLGEADGIISPWMGGADGESPTPDHNIVPRAHLPRGDPVTVDVQPV
jgi:hypothetical protein